MKEMEKARLDGYRAWQDQQVHGCQMLLSSMLLLLMMIMMLMTDDDDDDDDG